MSVCRDEDDDGATTRDGAVAGVGAVVGWQLRFGWEVAEDGIT